MIAKLFRLNGAKKRARETSDPEPRNRTLDAANPDSVNPPVTDEGSVPTFKYPFSMAHRRLHEGGWSHEVTTRELPVAKTLAGVVMRLTAGGVRELHWHAAAEWGILLYGGARLTAIDADGKSFVDDVRDGDIWFFPPGIPHSIQGLRPEGAKFLLVFDDGNFSEYNTVLLTDWVAHTPREVLAKNFGVPRKALEKIRSEKLFIYQGEIPSPLACDQQSAARASGMSPVHFAFRGTEPAVSIRTKGGTVRIVDSRSFKVSTVASAEVTVHPGAMRELHWHPNADEWQYYLSGKGRMTVFASGGHARTTNFEAGDVGYVQRTLPHYVENTGNADLIFLEMFKSSYFQDLSLSQWLTHTPPELVTEHLMIDKAVLEEMPKAKVPVMPQ
ncbi:MAG TPA: cupin domain-containing protein [Terriglobia bacterium]|nr:cupin domain-containing protein [Terriglobia bacterium]